MSITDRKHLTAKELPLGKVVYVDGLDTIEDTLALMRAEKVEAVIVKKRNEQDAYGIVVLSDIVKGVLVPDLNPSEVNVYEVMSKPVITIPSDMNERYIPRFLLKTDLRVCPIEKDGEFLGMISFSTLLLEKGV